MSIFMFLLGKAFDPCKWENYGQGTSKQDSIYHSTRLTITVHFLNIDVRSILCFGTI
jgi:hypothetical protein